MGTAQMQGQSRGPQVCGCVLPGPRFWEKAFHLSPLASWAQATQHSQMARQKGLLS